MEHNSCLTLLLTHPFMICNRNNMLNHLHVCKTWSLYNEAGDQKIIMLNFQNLLKSFLDTLREKNNSEMLQLH